MKKGFTLMELLVVIVIVSVISVSSVLAFGNIDDSTAIKDRINVYKNIQRSAKLYVDLNNSWLNQFRAKGFMYIGIMELKNSNYVDIEVEDPVTGEEIPSNYIIKIYTAKDSDNMEYIDTCIIDKIELNSIYCRTDVPCVDGLTCPDENNCRCYNQDICNRKKCVANSNGEPYDCCAKSTED